MHTYYYYKSILIEGNSLKNVEKTEIGKLLWIISNKYIVNCNAGMLVMILRQSMHIHNLVMFISD